LIKEAEVAKQTIPTVETILIKAALNFTTATPRSCYFAGLRPKHPNRKIKELE